MISFYTLPPAWAGLRPYRLVAPYLPDFAKEARMMGAEWDKSRREWAFPEPEWKARQVIENFYGYCPPDQPDFVDAIVDLSNQNRKGWCIAFGRVLANRSHWNQVVMVHETCSILSGKFPTIHPDNEKRLGDNDVRLLVRGIPLSLATQPPKGIKVERVLYSSSSEDEGYLKAAMVDTQTRMVEIAEKLKNLTP